MQTRTLFALLLAVALAAPTAAAAPTGTLAQSADAGSETDAGAASNYTALYVDAETSHLRLKPGESDSFELTVENGEEEDVSLSPHLYVPPVGEDLLDPAWVTIDGPTTLDAGEEATFDVSVAVPESAELGSYRGQIALTNETVTYPGRPARPVHAVSTYVEVWKEPAVEITSPTYFSGQVKAGDETTYEIVVENDGEETAPLSPEILSQNRRYGGSTDSLDASWITIDAPAEVAPGESETVTVTVAAPESADRGRYDAQIDLGLKDPNRPEQSTYWQEVDLGVEVWKQPAEPYETSFDVSEDADSVAVTLSPRTQRDPGEDGETAGFDAELVSPDGTVVPLERVRTTDSGFVDLSGQARNADAEGAYASQSASTEFRYRAALGDDAAGEWTLRVMPRNTIGFNYEVVRNESA